ncbi:UPF0182 family protein [Candidatus Woesearchaeota archaeon]|nr:UPF0182 family protein [Candidatus Woesearchaeota archaeon]
MPMELRRWISSIIIALIILLLTFITTIARLLTDYWWFDALGFRTIFMVSLKAKLTLFAVIAALFFIFMAVNLWITGSKTSIKLKLGVSAVLALFVGLMGHNHWFRLLQYQYQSGFGIQDPVFMKDIAFYVFSLPFFNAVWGIAFWCIILTILVVAADYLRSSLTRLAGINRMHAEQPQPVQMPKLGKKPVTHLGILGALAFIMVAIRHHLSKFSIMYSEKGIVVGAGYTDVAVVLPAIKIMIVLALIVAVIFALWAFLAKKMSKRHILMIAIGGYIAIFFIGMSVIPGIVQSLKVSPNEINLETPYIERNIKFTRMAYGIDDIENKDFEVQPIDKSILKEASSTLDNVRLLDWRPLTQTYKQTQEIRLYYDLAGIDIDRYNISGEYTEVMLSPRELNQNKIASNAKTWVNLHMIYTHGYGIVMSPVNDVTEAGLPEYLIKDIPPVYSVEDENLMIDKPQIYYGEQSNTFVLVNTDTKEFDYPKGNTNEYMQYDGDGGVVLDSFFKKLMMAVRFTDIKILLSSDVKPQSKILFKRSIKDRINKVMPFLMLDNDPYLVIDQGRMHWIQDAYTVTSRYPYSEKADTTGMNYIRNSVKVVVDAYDGSVTYYVIDESDPIVKTYARIFPNQFAKFSSMPEGLKKHVRYPEGLFSIQAEMYQTYHMEDPVVFYNKEDAWEIPNEIYGTGQQVQMEPYYIIINLPEEEEPEFILMTPFTPIRKDNMIAWMAARSDGKNYGKLLVYKFPKDKLVYGPSQIEAKFDQDSEISQQLTLWSQRGSRVTRGNLLVIPIDESVLYIEPLYLQAEQGEIPEMKRVLVSDGEKVVMEETLDIALEALFGRAEVDTGEKGRTQEELIQEADRYYDNILESMGNDWQAFGENFDKLGEVLKELKG